MSDKNFNILIVDDVPENLDVLTGMLEKYGFKIRPVTNGKAALKAMRIYPPDIILLDVNMPDMNGYDVCEQLKADDKLKDIPVIFISALSETIDKVRAFAVGGVDYITKPFQYEEVLARIETHLKIHQMQEELKAGALKLELKNKELESFSYILSHDLRAPLRHITFFSHTLLDEIKTKMNEKEEEYFHNILATCEKMSQMIEDILKLSKLSFSELKYSKIDLSKIASDILKEIQTGNDDRKVEIIIKPDIIVNADIDLIRIALFNLLNNAWKYSSKNPLSRIEFGMHIEKVKKIFFVKDNGAGFDMKFKDKLFKPFERLHLSADFEGNGIGLAIVHKIISLHKGEVWAESEVGKGTAVYFTLG